MLAESSVKAFLDKTAGNEPVPGGGSISALCAAIASALTEMVAGLTIGKKNYVDVEDEMKDIASRMAALREEFIQCIDRDSDAYDKVFAAFKMPKETDEEKEARTQEIQKATLVAAMVPMGVADLSVRMMDLIAVIAHKGNKNAVTDACVAMMNARTAVLGALLNVRINLLSLKDQSIVAELTAQSEEIEKDAIAKEQELLTWVKTQL